MPNRKPAAASAARAGFTLIELLVVIALIGVLTSLLVVGIGKMQTSGKRQQTIGLLHNCQAVFASYNAAVHTKFPSSDQNPCPGPVTEGLQNLDPPTPDGKPLLYRRFGIAAQTTRSLFASMRAVPDARAGLDKLPAAQLMENKYLYNYDRQIWTPGQTYGPDQQPNYYATVDNGASGYTVYLCLADHVASDGAVQYQTGEPNPNGLTVGQNIPANRPPDTNYWLPFSSDVTGRILVDGWGNPIIVCFGSLGSIRTPPVTLNTATRIAGHFSDGNLYANGQSVVVTSPDHRLFFASAGPDGDFGLGDDNLYSFEP